MRGNYTDVRGGMEDIFRQRNEILVYSNNPYKSEKNLILGNGDHGSQTTQEAFYFYFQVGI